MKVVAMSPRRDSSAATRYSPVWPTSLLLRPLVIVNSRPSRFHAPNSGEILASFRPGFDLSLAQRSRSVGTNASLRPSRHHHQLYRSVVTRRLIIRKIPVSHDHSAAALPRPGRLRDKREIQTAIRIYGMRLLVLINRGRKSLRLGWPVLDGAITLLFHDSNFA